MPTDADALLDLLLDLKHDLGKHLGLPINMLPADASAQQLREAARQAFFRTRTSPQGVRSAREIWEAFRRQTAVFAGGRALCAQLAPAATQALAWEHRLDRDEALDRDALQADVRTLRDAIAQAIAEVAHD